VAASSARPATFAVLAIVALAALRVTASQSANSTPAPTTSRVFRYIMGTSIGIEAYGGSEAARSAAIDEAFGAIAEIDRLMSNYRADSELTQLNRLAATEAVRVSDPMLSVLQAAHRVSAMSGGAFDVTVGPIVRLWGLYDKVPHVPTAGELATVRPLVDYRNVVIDAAQHTVRFTRAGVNIDLGGIAKGFAVEVAANELRRRGLSGFIDAGGNQYLLGTPPHKSSWTTGIKSADGDAHLLGVLETGETSISTSANYATYVESNGRKYGHIIDPRTLAPSDASLSVTVVSRDATIADAMSKAVFILGHDAGLKLVASVPGTSALIAYRRPDGLTAVAISPSLSKAFHPADARIVIDR
jgi:thiamine biosynthesis lipoprotein ApbE